MELMRCWSTLVQTKVTFAADDANYGLTQVEKLLALVEVVGQSADVTEVDELLLFDVVYVGYVVEYDLETDDGVAES